MKAALLSIALAATVLGGQSEFDLAQAACLSDSEARSVVSSGEAAPLSAALGRHGVRGRVVSAELCERGGRLVYVVSVLDPRSGEVRRLTIPAG